MFNISCKVEKVSTISRCYCKVLNLLPYCNLFNVQYNHIYLLTADMENVKQFTQAKRLCARSYPKAHKLQKNMLWPAKHNFYAFDIFHVWITVHSFQCKVTFLQYRAYINIFPALPALSVPTLIYG